MRSTESVTYKIGPVDAAAARQWTENALRMIAAIRRNPAAIPIRVPPEVLDTCQERLEQWHRAAGDTEVFEFVGAEDETTARLLLTYWMNLSSLSEEEMERLGTSRSPESARPFADAAIHAIVECLDLEDPLRIFALRTRRPSS